MSFINNLSSWVSTPLSYLPVSASQASHVGTFFGGIAMTNFCYGSPWGAALTGITALASYAASRVKAVQEQQVEDKKLSEQFTLKFLGLLKGCVDHPSNQASDKNQAGFTEDNIQRMREIIHTLEKENCCKATRDPENNRNLRASLVGLQGASEHLMAVLTLLKDVTSVNIVFHVPSPITPLCQPLNAEELAGLKDIPSTEDEIVTVKKRTFTIRQLLSQPCVKAHVEYPQGGKLVRKQEEIEIYLQSCQQFPETLVDHELFDLKEMEQAKIGATYVLEIPTGQSVVVSIKISQIIDVNQTGPVAFYVGPHDTPAIKERVDEVSRYLVSVGGTDIRQLIKR
jgi:hypothetical protein